MTNNILRWRDVSCNVANVFRIGPAGARPYSAPKVTDATYDHPSNTQYLARNRFLLDVLHRTLIIDPRDRPDAPWLTQHLHKYHLKKLRSSFFMTSETVLLRWCFIQFLFRVLVFTSIL